jgi:formylglycine-generating enzyme required for sulfatase activity
MTGRKSLLAALALLALSALPASSQDAGKRYAVLAGVEDYQHENLRRPKLEYAVEDVTDLGAVLRAAGYEVVLLTDDTGRRDPSLAPTRANIERVVTEVLRRSGKADTVIIAFAGHGLQFQGQPDAFFCPADARPFADETATMVSVSKVYQELEKSFAGVKVLLVDACRNDPDPGRGRGVDGDNSPRPPRGVAALFSCSAGEKAYEHRDLAHGVFFHSVLDGLRGKASDSNGKVTWDSLQAHVRSQVPELMKLHLPDRAQQPNLKADLVGSPPVLLRVAAVAERRAAEDSALASGAVVIGRTVTNSIGMMLVRVPAGEFLMGSTDADLERLHALFPGTSSQVTGDEKPQHRVRITKAIDVGAREVTVGQFKAFAAATGYKTEAEADGVTNSGWNEVKGQFEWDSKYTWRNPGFAQTDVHPVVLVSWNDAAAFCRWLSRKEELEYRLLTEAEWEYVCRAGTTSLFPEGDDPEVLAKVGNVADKRARSGLAVWSTIRADDGYLYTAPVGSYRPNDWGLYDMLGNVAEWCADWYARDYYAASPQEDPPGRFMAQIRAHRGACWTSPTPYCRAAHRAWDSPSGRSTSLGFRVVRVP